MRPIIGHVVERPRPGFINIELENGRIIGAVNRGGWRLFDKLLVFYDFTRKEVRKIEKFDPTKEVELAAFEEPEQVEPDHVRDDDLEEFIEMTDLALTGDGSVSSVSVSGDLALAGERSEGSVSEELELSEHCEELPEEFFGDE